MAAAAIIGAGLMGTGLARLFSAFGWPVTVWDRDGAALARLAAAVPAARTAAGLAETVADAGIVIEAIAEIAGAKQALFAELAGMTGAHTILATNSSVIPVGTVTACLSDGDAARCVGTHFWNPPDLIPLVEVIEGPRTAAATIVTTMQIMTAAGKEPVHVRRDTVPGNRLQHALWREAIALVEEGVCSPEDVDRLVKRSFGLRLPVLGPLENADLVGLELTRAIHDVVLPTLSRATAASPAVCDRIAAGATGAAAGRGFYASWSDADIASLKSRLGRHLASLLDR